MDVLNLLCNIGSRERWAGNFPFYSGSAKNKGSGGCSCWFVVILSLYLLIVTRGAEICLFDSQTCSR